jgi:hypothetical protein
MAATWITCAQCGRIEEIAVDAQVPSGWREVGDGLHCPMCSDTATGDVLDEEIIYPSQPITLDEDADDFCEVCKGPCQGH